MEMGNAQFDPEEVIDLVSSDIEPSSPKKRPLEVDDTPLNGESSLRDSKRARIVQPATAEPEPQSQEPTGEDSLGAEEGEIEEEEPQEGPQNLTIKGSGSIDAPSTTELRDTPPIPQGKIPTQPAGWNPTINNTVLRTSLNRPAAPSPSRIFKFDSLSFELPDLSDRKEGSWLERFKEWTRAFQDTNSKLTHAITPNLVQSAYVDYIDSISGMKPKKRKSAKQASKEIERTGELAALLSTIQPTVASQVTPATQPLKQSVTKGTRKGKSSRASSISEDGVAIGAHDHASDSEVEYEPMLKRPEETEKAIPSANEWASLLEDAAQANGNSKSQAPTKKEETVSASTSFTSDPIMTKRNIPTGALALEQQHKYFPSASDSTQMCLLCGRGTHLAPYCPTLICSFCGSLEHSDLCCPDRVRCDKCRQLGHRTFQCVEKLSLTSGEGLACSVCNSLDHLERDCTMVWRSFHPEAGTIKKVEWIPATCALCGSNQHFSSDCKRDWGYMSNPTWSVENRDKYVNAACGVTSIEGASEGQTNASTTRAPELKIRGHAARTTNVHYSESDDSDVEFLGHQPAQKRAPVGRIRMASNIQMPGNAGSRGGNEQWSPVQPPLPPGPPPGLPSRPGSYGYPPPPGMSYGTQPSGPPPSLPMKPPITRSYRNVPPPPNHQDSSGRLGNKPPKGPRAGSKFTQRGGRGGRGGGGRGRGRAK